MSGALALETSTLSMIVDVRAVSEISLSDVDRDPNVIDYFRIDVVPILTGVQCGRQRIDPVGVMFPACSVPYRRLSICHFIPPFFQRHGSAADVSHPQRNFYQGFLFGCLSSLFSDFCFCFSVFCFLAFSLSLLPPLSPTTFLLFLLSKTSSRSVVSVANTVIPSLLIVILYFSKSVNYRFQEEVISIRGYLE